MRGMESRIQDCLGYSYIKKIKRLYCCVQEGGQYPMTIPSLEPSLAIFLFYLQEDNQSCPTSN